MELIYKLIKNLKLGDVLSNPTRVTGGLLNRMYKVKTSSGTYAIKYLNPEVMKRPNAKYNHIFAEKIANLSKEKDIPCLPALIFDGTPLQEIDNNYFLIYNWFDGRAISDEELNIDKVKKIAEILAKIHNLDYGEIINECKLGIELNEINWDYYINLLDNNEIKELIIKNKDRLVELDKISTSSAKKIRERVVISHRDMDLPNILWDKDENPMLIDWESSGIVNPTEELVETAWDWAGGQEHFDLNLFKTFINIYKQNGGDIKDLNKAIYADFKNKAGWLEYNLKRVCRLECIDEEEYELGIKEVKRVINEIIVFYDTLINLTYR